MDEKRKPKRLPADLAEVVDAWPVLRPLDRAKILELARAARLVFAVRAEEQER